MSEFELLYLRQGSSQGVSLLAAGWITIQFAVITAAYFMQGKTKKIIKWFLFINYLIWTFIIYVRMILSFIAIAQINQRLVEQGFAFPNSIGVFLFIGFVVLGVFAIVGTYIILFQYDFSKIKEEEGLDV